MADLVKKNNILTGDMVGDVVYFNRLVNVITSTDNKHTSIK